MNGLSVAYGEKTAVADLTATIASGELVALLGPSGCGKSTTLLAVAGLLNSSAGSVRFDGRIMNEIPTEQRDVGMVFQQYSLYPHMTVYDNIAFPLTMKKWPKSDIRRRVDELAELLRIGELLARRPDRLSGGQQQRAAIARALAKRPKLLLMDEPFSHLDSSLRLELREEFRFLQQRFGITTLFVTHDQEEALSLSDRIMVMADGRMLQYDTPEQVYHRPSSRRAAEIAGHPPMNFLEAEGQPWTLGARAEDWLMADGDTALVRGRIAVIEKTGKDTLLKVRAPSALLRVYASAEWPVAVGQEIGLQIRPGRAHWFDSRTGSRLEAGPELSELRWTGA
ncbi:carbohydrate ABC transporter ATP-binding protein (CUT1 family) [Cohnella sp. SGD-V74]|nr:carbohydrate ABC transporter ATP-binding protein (CUT1 family) [Cohnella sp. SGD-V74]